MPSPFLKSPSFRGHDAKQIDNLGRVSDRPLSASSTALP